MRGCGFSEVRVDGWGNVIGLRRGGQPGPTLLFDGHMDVVDPGPEPWAHDPYGGEVAQGRLWGRGAADTKGALAAMICAGAGLPMDDLAGTLVVAATVCEENLTGAALGHVLGRVHLADLVITGEPTGLRLGVAQKGRATLRLHATGRSAHTSQPELGDNAVYKMIEAVRPAARPAVAGRSRAGPRRAGAGRAPLRAVAQPNPGPGRVSRPFRGTYHARRDRGRLPGPDRRGPGRSDRRHATPSTACANPATPARCWKRVDFLPGWRCPTEVDPWRSALLAALAAAGLPADTYAAPCGTNASESAGRRGIPSFIYGPGTLAQAHIVDEWVAIADLHAALAGYAAIARRVMAGDKHLP